MPIPFIMIELDRPRKLRFGMGAMVEFEQLTKKKVTELSTEDISGEIFAKLLWIMLRQEDETLTEKDVNRLVDEYADDLTTVCDLVGKAVQAAFNSGESEKNLKPAARKKN